MFMRLMRGFAFLFVWFFFLCSVFPAAAAEPELFRVVISGGGLVRVFQPYAAAYCDFLLKNNSGHSQTFIVRIQSKNKANDPNAYFSKSFTVPAKTEKMERMQFRLDDSETYLVSAEVFPDSIKLEPQEVKAPHPRIIPDTGQQEKLYLILTDDSQGTIGDILARAPEFYRRSHGIPMQSKDIPADFSLLEQYSAILLYRTDFSCWQSKTFELIRQFVQNGGTLLIASPEDLERTAETPLADLAPARMNSKAKPAEASLNQLFMKKYGKLEFMKTPFPVHHLKPAPGATVLHKYGQMPVLAEKCTGKGVCRTTATDLSPQGVTYAGKGWGKLFTELLRSNQPPVPVRTIEYTKEDNKIQGDTTIPFVVSLQKAVQKITKDEDTVFALMLVMAAGSLMIILSGFFIKMKFLHNLLALIAYNAAAIALLFVSNGIFYSYIPAMWLKNLF